MEEEGWEGEGEEGWGGGKERGKGGKCVCVWGRIRSPHHRVGGAFIETLHSNVLFLLLSLGVWDHGDHFPPGHTNSVPDLKVQRK